MDSDTPGRSWNLDTMVRTDPDGTTHPRSEWSDAEKAAADSWLATAKLNDLFTQLRTLIGSVELITTQAEADITMAETRQGDIQDWQTATTAHAGVIRSVPSPTVAQIKEELAVACERDVTIAGQLDNIYGWRSLVDQLLELLAQCVAGLARLITRTTNGAP